MAFESSQQATTTIVIYKQIGFYIHITICLFSFLIMIIGASSKYTYSSRIFAMSFYSGIIFFISTIELILKYIKQWPKVPVFFRSATFSIIYYLIGILIIFSFSTVLSKYDDSLYIACGVLGYILTISLTLMLLLWIKLVINSSSVNKL